MLRGPAGGPRCLEATVDLDSVNYLVYGICGDGGGWNAAQGRHNRLPWFLEMTFNKESTFDDGLKDLG